MNKNIALMALTGILTLAACGQDTGTVTCADGQTLTNGVCVTTTTPTAPRVLTFTVNGVTSSVPVTVTRADGTIVGTYNVSNGQRLELPAGSYIVVPGTVAGYTNNGNQAVNLTNGNGTATLNYTAQPGVQTAVLTIDLVNVGSAPITIRNAQTGEIVAGYNQALTADGTTVTLPRGTYTILGGSVGNSVAPAQVTADLTGGNATATLTYTNNAALTGAFYINAAGQRVYFAADPAKLQADMAAGLFRFNAWLQNRDGGITADGTTITGGATDDERTEFAPVNTQNVVGSYIEYNDGGTWRPVINGEVQMEILEQDGNVRFAAADDQNRSTMEALDISANALSSKSWTNLATNPTNIPYPSSASYPTYNMTGVTSANTNGYTWAALNHDPMAAYNGSRDGDIVASARLRAIGYVNGLEIDKQFLNKNYVASANVEIIKEIVRLDRQQNDTVIGVLGDSNPTYVPGEEIGVRIRVRNIGQAPANNIALTDALTSGTAASHAIGFSDALRRAATAQGITITNSTDDGFSATIDQLAPGAEKSIVFVATGVQDGTYCDTGTITSYVNGRGLLAPVYADVTTGHLNSVEGNPSLGLPTNQDATCFTVQGVPGLTIVKTLVDTRGTETQDDDVTLPDNTQVARNQNVRIRVIVRNNGTGAATGVTVTDRLTSGNEANQSITLVGGNGTATLVGNDGFDWNIGTLNAGAVATYDFNARAAADGTYCDTATLASTNTTPLFPTDSACYNVATPFLEISKTNQPSVNLRAGDTYTSTIIVKNTGTLTATQITVRDLIGRLVDSNGLAVNPVNQLQFASGRYVVGVIDPATGELRPIGQEKGVTTDGTTQPNQTVRTIGDVVGDIDQGITLPPNGYIAFNVVTTIPAGQAPGRYCDVASFTAAPNVLFTSNRAEACINIAAVSAIQPQLDDSIDPISKASAEGTFFTAVAYNEAQSTEGLRNNVLTFRTGMPQGTNTPGSFDISNITVYFDPTASDQGSGQVVFNPNTGTNGDIRIVTTQATITPVVNGVFTITMPEGFVVNPDGALFVTFNGAPNAAANVGDYDSSMVWSSNGTISGDAKVSQPTGETTTVTN